MMGFLKADRVAVAPIAQPYWSLNTNSVSVLYSTAWRRPVLGVLRICFNASSFLETYTVIIGFHAPGPYQDHRNSPRAHPTPVLG
jgi:hypothetical protein